jgi:hypothetical protein
MNESTSASSTVCPRCGNDLIDVATMSSRGGVAQMRVDEPLDVGRCHACSRLFRRLHSVGTWKSETFAPVCRVCRNRELSLDTPASTPARQVYSCRLHPRQRWTLSVSDGLWTEYSPR